MTVIVIDYDDTYTADPLLWNWFIDQAKERGHDVWCVSCRHQIEMEDPKLTIGLLIGEDRCVGTNGVAKRDYLFRHHGVYGHIWIDDNPSWVDTGMETSEDGWVTQYDGSKK